MKILQVVTYISPDGAYGGPVRVAINQAKALEELGHEVTLAASAGGFQGSLPNEYDGFPVRLFSALRMIPGAGFSGLVSPGLMSWLATAVSEADVVHVHLARDLVTLPAAILALIKRKTLVVQTHGMIDETHKVLGKLLDVFWTKPVLRTAKSVLYLTDREKNDLIKVAGDNLNLHRLHNAVTVPAVPATEIYNGPSSSPEILYLARLHKRKRPGCFVKAAVDLSTKWPEARFTLIGPDEGQAEKIRSVIAENKKNTDIEWEGPLAPDKTIDRMRKASIYALPSVDEPFPMSVLEAMAVGLPVVVTKTCGLAAVIQQNEAGIVCEHDQESFTNALDTLIQQPAIRLAMATNGRATVAQYFSPEHIGAKLEKIYASSLS